MCFTTSINMRELINIIVSIFMLKKIYIYITVKITSNLSLCVLILYKHVCTNNKNLKPIKIKIIQPGSPNKKKFFSHQPTHMTPIATTILEAANELDFNTSQDMNNDGFHIPRRDGGSFTFTPVSTRTGTRLSAEHLYLKSRRKKNLTILTNAKVVKVINYIK